MRVGMGIAANWGNRFYYRRSRDFITEVGWLRKFPNYRKSLWVSLIY